MIELIATPDIVRASLVVLWQGMIGFVPRLVAALLVLFIGGIVSVLLGKIAYHIIRIVRLDDALRRVGFRAAWEKSGFRLDSAQFFYELVKWLFVAVFLMAATNILGLNQVSDFLRTVVLYLPNVIVAVIILLIGIIIARFLEDAVRASVRAAGLASGNFLGALIKWAVFVFTLLIALAQLEVAADIIRIVVVGLVGASSLAIGLSFGLGGVKHADELIANLRRKIRD